MTTRRQVLARGSSGTPTTPVWVARKRAASGDKELVREGFVERRMRTVGETLYGLTREEAKRVVHQELFDWLSDARAATADAV